jgi:S-formylglutathione hydrolase FrmB
VLYLLHGLTGAYNDWADRTRVLEHLAGLDLIVVMPDANDSWYTNAGSDKYEDYVAVDLVKEVDARFRTLSAVHGRAIAGLSMGGYGAIKIALHHPRLFLVAGSFSGAFEVLRDDKPGRWMSDPALFERLFGPPGSPGRQENDVYKLVSKANAQALPYLYLDCGTEDGLLQGNRDLVALLQQRQIVYEYHESPGAHTWDYWDRRLPELLRVLRQKKLVS